MLQADQESWSLVIVHVDPGALTGVLPLAGHEVVVRRGEAVVSLSWPGAHLAMTSVSPVKAGVSHGVCRGRWRCVVVTPGQAVSVGPAVPVVALPGVPPSHLVLLTLHPVVPVVVLQRRGTQWSAVVLPLRLAK